MVIIYVNGKKFMGVNLVVIFFGIFSLLKYVCNVSCSEPQKMDSSFSTSSSKTCDLFLMQICSK